MGYLHGGLRRYHLHHKSMWKKPQPIISSITHWLLSTEHTAFTHSSQTDLSLTDKNLAQITLVTDDFPFLGKYFWNTQFLFARLKEQHFFHKGLTIVAKSPMSQFTCFIRKVFVWKILLSGKFLLFLTLRRSSPFPQLA